MTVEQRRELVLRRDSERVKEADRKRGFRETDPQKIRARNATRILGKGQHECEVCGAPRAHAHHDDYSLPLDVRWLCPIHHAEVHKRKEDMARQTILVSDLTGNPIPDGQGATVRITPHQNGDGVYELHVVTNEVETLIEKSRSVKRRGRRPKVTVEAEAAAADSE